MSRPVTKSDYQFLPSIDGTTKLLIEGQLVATFSLDALEQMHFDLSQIVPLLRRDNAKSKANDE